MSASVRLVFMACVLASSTIAAPGGADAEERITCVKAGNAYAGRCRPLVRRRDVLGRRTFGVTTESSSPLRLPTQTATWGFESWDCGDKWFDIRLGSGRDVIIDRIDGVANAIVGPNADPSRRWVRAALVTLTPGGATPPSPALVLSKPSGRAQQAVAGNLLSVILKQRGDHEVHLPLAQLYLSPPVLAGGRLRALVDTQTYAGDAGQDATIARDHPEECLDSEVQLVVQFHELG